MQVEGGNLIVTKVLTACTPMAKSSHHLGLGMKQKC